MAHAQLVGSFQVARIAGRDGSPVSLSHVLDVGSLAIAIVHVCTEGGLVFPRTAEQDWLVMLPHFRATPCR